ncbi:UDP-glucose flavonoid 3-O-glucosyltransferase 7-like isoform X2 [Vigna unguiculata]|uniref:Glycosyltransferase n=1 Tax=Vigna unguiculata TaxID=3917 RepID=A0A4D6NCC3_VIGUN|nr:UDP-glucose flavonoid 3-O-glucosyltransferase 7-like isoform X2 [Vigna unguiculata]QCE11483.1 UDP-glucosyl transferase 73C [Vigna unguiculata]
MEGLFSEADSSSLKLYLLPFPSPGHMMPQINLGQVLAFRGHHVTVLTTPSNAQFIPKHLKVHTFNLPSNEHGLSSENLSSAEDNRTAYKIWKATQDLKPQIETFLQQNPPHAVILDIMFPWNFSSTLNIATAVYNPMPIFALCVAEAINNSQHQAFPSDSSLSFVVPGSLPHNVTLNFNPWTTSFHTMARTMLQAKENNSVGVIVDTFAELEDGYTEYYQKLTGVKVWHVGKLSLMVDYYHRRGTSSQENHVGGEHECLNWLSTKEARSVVYVCFGSLSRLSKEQYLEIARGLEASGHNFILVLPKKVNEEGLLHGIEERMREDDRGMVVRGWVPQGLILKHVGIGGFLTHCGASSVLEGICEGVPLITMPRFGDQFLCEKLVTEVLGIGESVGVWEWSMSPYDVRKELVGWERIESAVRKVMKDEGGLFRKRVKELKEKAHKAVQEGGSSYHNVTALLQSIKVTNV